MSEKWQRLWIKDRWSSQLIVQAGDELQRVLVNAGTGERAARIVREHNAHASLVEALDPDALEAIADELAPFDKGGARIHSLRVIAKAQRAALALAEDGA